MLVDKGFFRSKARVGMSLVEVLVGIAIVGILAAVAIPSLSRYIKDSKLSEAATNIQGVLEAEQAYFVEWRRFTGPLSLCPNALPPTGENQIWAPCDNGWTQLGWQPDGPVFFQYEVFSHHDPTLAPPNNLNQLPQNVLGANANLYGVSWVDEGFVAAPVQPWCVVQARADTDGDGILVFMRSNSYNQKVTQLPNNTW